MRRRPLRSHAFAIAAALAALIPVLGHAQQIVHCTSKNITVTPATGRAYGTVGVNDWALQGTEVVAFNCSTGNVPDCEVCLTNVLCGLDPVTGKYAPIRSLSGQANGNCSLTNSQTWDFQFGGLNYNTPYEVVLTFKGYDGNYNGSTCENTDNYTVAYRWYQTTKP